MKKWMRRVVPGVLIGLSLAAGVVAGPVVLMPGPVDLEAGESRRQLWLLPSQDPAVPMQTTVFRPPGEGPFPLVLMTGLKQSGRGLFKCCVNQELTMSRTVARMHHCRARRKGVRGGAAEVGR